MREATLQAGVADIGRSVQRRADRRDAPAADMCLQPAADTPVAAGCAYVGLEALVGHIRSSVISVIASVGQLSAQAPQDTQVESRNPPSRPAAMLAPKPRPVAVSANAPWTSSQARTQRPQEMHSSCWNARYGWRSSWSRACVAPGQRGT